MRTVALFALAGLICGGCSSAGNNRQEPALHAKYARYIALLDKHRYDDAIDYLSDRNITDLTTNAGRAQFRAHFPVVSTINEVLSNETRAFETIQAGSGCLTVIGSDASAEPTSMNIEYIHEHGTWKIDYVQVVYHETSEQVPKTAVCPNRSSP